MNRENAALAGPTTSAASRPRFRRWGRPIGWFDFTAYPLLILWAIIALLPLYWMFTTSFRVSSHIMEMPPQFWPQPASLENGAALDSE